MGTATQDIGLSRDVSPLKGIYPIIADDIVYQGAMAGDNGLGYARPLVAGDLFLGHAFAQCDNSGGIAGAKNVEVLKGLYTLQVTLSGVVITDVGNPVYASDDTTLTLSTGSVSHVGRVLKYVSANTAIVEFRAPGDGDVTLGALNESGVAGYGIPISSARIRAQGVYADDAGAALTAGWYMASFHQFTIANAQVALANISVFGHVGEVHLNASIEPGGNHAGVFAYAEVQTGKTLEMGSNISFSGLLAGIDLPAGAILGSGVLSAIAAGGNLGGTHTGKVVGLHFTNPSDGAYDYFMQIGGLGTDTTGFSDATAHGSTESGRLKLRSGSNVKYIHLFDD